MTTDTGRTWTVSQSGTAAATSARTHAAGRAAGGVGAEAAELSLGAGIVGAVGSAYAQPEQDSTNTEQRYGQSSAYGENARQARDARVGTRDKGSRDRGSGQE